MNDQPFEDNSNINSTRNPILYSLIGFGSEILTQFEINLIKE